MGPGGATEVKEGSLNGEGDVDEVDEVDGGEEVVGMTENEPELASFTTVTWPGKTGPVTLHIIGHIGLFNLVVFKLLPNPQF